MTTTSRTRRRARLAHASRVGPKSAHSSHKAERIQRTSTRFGEGNTDPLFPGSGYFEQISDRDVHELLGPLWTRSDPRLQVAWELALHGRPAGWLVTHCGVTPAFAQTLASKAAIATPRFFASSTPSTCPSTTSTSVAETLGP